MTFQTWVADLIEQRFKTATALAGKVGMKLSPFTRGVAAGTLNLVNLLNLAKVAEEKPSMVLRLAGKGREADLFEEVYGPEKAVHDPTLQRLLKHWPTFTADERFLIRLTVGTVLRAKGAVPDEGEGEIVPPKKRRVKASRKRDESSEETALKKRGRST